MKIQRARKGKYRQERKFWEKLSEKFAELIVQECIGVVENLSPGYKDYRDQIEDAFRRDCVEEMKHNFYTIENGKYAAKLFELFGKERVESELELFLSYNFFPRFGGGIGLTRMARAWELLQQTTEKEVEELV